MPTKIIKKLIMKNLFYLMLPTLLFIVSSGDKTNLEVDNTEFKFTKEMTISDEDGNSADLIIHANSEETMNEHTEDVLLLLISMRLERIGLGLIPHHIININ
jgi:hypothetical protein